MLKLNEMIERHSKQIRDHRDSCIEEILEQTINAESKVTIKKLLRTTDRLIDEHLIAVYVRGVSITASCPHCSEQREKIQGDVIPGYPPEYDFSY